MSSQSDAQLPGWQGMTIKEILEKVDLFNISALVDEEKKTNETLGVKNATQINPETAFLGPRVWNKPITLQLEDDETDFSVMNIDDFLNENSIDVDDTMGMDDPDEVDESNDDSNLIEVVDESKGRKRHSNAVMGADTTFLYAESKAARLEREREEKRKAALKMEFSPEDLALATIPGMTFDPRERAFSVDELRPQPIVRKRKKAYVPSNSKDEKYWEKRVKNNIAARRSREARRLKENQIALRAAFLEKENAALRSEVKKVAEESKKLAAEKEALTAQLKALQAKLGL